VFHSTNNSSSFINGVSDGDLIVGCVTLLVQPAFFGFDRKYHHTPGKLSASQLVFFWNCNF